MLSKVPLAVDEGDQCKLPNGETVSLRATFPSSGLYDVGSTEPIWTVDWYGESRLVRLSDDARYVVVINRFGGGGDRFDHPLSWGIRFFDRGREIANHNVQDLVEFPSLIPFTTSDWHNLWIDQSVYDTEIQNGILSLRTSTHEWYRFDVSTGRIVNEFRMWRIVARGIAALALMVLIGGLVVLRRSKWGSRPKADRETAVQAKKWQAMYSYSVRALLIVVTGAALLAAVFRVAPNAGVFLSALITTVALTWIQRACAGWTRAAVWPLTIFAWVLLYVLSFGPAMWMVEYFNWGEDCCLALCQTVYRPALWLLENMHLGECRPIQLYMDAW
jgi:hypothetical protein